MHRKLLTGMLAAALLAASFLPQGAPRALAAEAGGAPAGQAPTAQALAARALPPLKDRLPEDEVLYFVFTDRFFNGDRTNDADADPTDLKAYHGGDLQGVIDKLDYIKGLGATAIWLTPVVDNEPGGYHGYWAADFYKTDEHLGSLEKLQELVTAAHGKGIKVLLDVVVNHTGYQHPWVTEKPDWFHQTGDITDWNNQSEIENNRLAGLPDFNTENPAVEKYLIDMGRWWIQKTDVDGFRLDTVRHVPTPFWERFAKAMHETKPGFWLMGEVWNTDPAYLAGYQKTGIDSLVSFPHYEGIRGVFGKDGLISTLQDAEEGLGKELPQPQRMGVFIDNHDVGRFISGAYQDQPVKRLELALTYAMTTRGFPVLYYGTEVALEGGGDPDNRRPMPWDVADQGHPLQAQIRRLAQIREAHPALRRGDWQPLAAIGDTLAFSRTAGTDRAVVVINNSDQPASITLNAASLPKGTVLQPALPGTEAPLTATGAEVTLTLPARSAQVYVTEAAPSALPWPWLAGLGGLATVLAFVFGLPKQKQR